MVIKWLFYGVSCLELEGERVVKLFAHVHHHMPMCMCNDEILPFAESWHWQM